MRREIFTDIWIKHGPYIFNFIRCYVHQVADAEDIFQDVAGLAYASFPSLRNEKAVKAWLLQIAKNRIKNYYRARKFTIDISEIEIQLIAQETKHDDRIIINDFLASLPPSWSRMLYLNLYYGVSSKEIANITGIGHHAIKKRITRSKKILARELTEGR